MSLSIKSLVKSIISGEKLDVTTARELLHYPDGEELFAGADTLRRHFCGNRFHLCSIINARSGECSEDCIFCAQSVHHCTEIEKYDLIAPGKALDMAINNDEHGVRRLSLVTSGRTVSISMLARLQELYELMGEKTSLLFCASMGLLDKSKAHDLKKMGVSRYHCNLEACQEFFPQVCTTHSWEQKVNTLEVARSAGMEVCSGGIIGMGESSEQRLALAFELRELGVRSIPINVLTPIPATPLGHLNALETEEVLRVIACFRFINPAAVIRLAGGRQLLVDEQYRCFSSGANGAIVGDYLTTVGSKIADDLKALTAMGYTF
ncbi:MAG: biotin synthase BioB [Desulfobulbaceae bacterium]|nr:biotin synthase BioB [Desulfobulbaceae bacterium]